MKIRCGVRSLEWRILKHALMLLGNHPNCRSGGKLARDEMVGPRNLKRVAGYIIDFACDMYALLKRKSAVHVYCLNGRSRSPAVIWGYYILFRGLNVDDANNYLTHAFRDQRPGMWDISADFPNFPKFRSVVEYLIS